MWSAADSILDQYTDQVMNHYLICEILGHFTEHLGHVHALG